MPSYKTSTLSMIVLYYFISLGIFVLLAFLIAWLSPDTFKLISEEKTVFLVLVGYFVLRGEGFVSAYLQRSNTGTSGGNIENATVNTEKPIIETDLSLTKLEAYDPSDK